MRIRVNPIRVFLLLFMMLTTSILYCDNVLAESKTEITQAWEYNSFQSQCKRNNPVQQKDSGTVGESALTGTILLPSKNFGNTNGFDAKADGKVACSTIMKNVIMPKLDKSKYGNDWSNFDKSKNTMVDILSYKHNPKIEGTTINVKVDFRYIKEQWMQIMGSTKKTSYIKDESETKDDYGLFKLKLEGGKWKLEGNIPDSLKDKMSIAINESGGKQSLNLKLKEPSGAGGVIAYVMLGNTWKFSGDDADKNLSIELSSSVEDTAKKINDKFSQRRWTFHYSSSSDHTVYVQYYEGNGYFNFSAAPADSTPGGNYTINGEMSISKLSAGAYTDASKADSIAKKDENLYQVYSYYVEQIRDEVGGVIECDNPVFNDNVEKVKLKHNGKVVECSLNLGQQDPNSFPVNIYNGPVAPTVYEGTLQDAIDWLNNKMNVAKVEASTDAPEVDDHDAIDDVTEPIDGEAAEVDPTCVSSAGPLGWILCPTAEGGADAVDGIYGYLEGKLNLGSELFRSGDDSGAFKAWSAFVTIANIGLIIVLILIIFSQFTGIGIDNYGIKKILPRLITGILLVEASFIIAQGAVDASNIFGSSCARAFKAIASTIDPNGLSAQITFTAIFDGILAIAGVVGPTAVTTALGIASVAAGGPAAVMMVLIPLIASIFTAIIAVVLFFLMIGLRSIVAIVCVAVSPIALLCYILPNTQKVFKLWFNAFKAVLVVYPICGLIYGAGQLAKAIIANDPSNMTFAMATIAALVPFLPFLVAPTLLRGALRSLGELGAKLQGLQQGAKGAINNVKRNAMDSDYYKEKMFQGQGQTAIRDVAKTNKKLQEARAQGKTGKARRLERRLAAKAHVANKYEEEMTGRRSGEMEQGFSFVDPNSGNEVTLDKASGADDYRLALEAEADKADNEVDEYRVSAIFDKLASMGEDGRQAIEDSVKDGKLKGRALKIVAHKVMSGGGDFKNRNRTTFEAFKTINGMKDQDASDVNQVKSAFTNAANNNRFDWLRSENITNLDENELRRFADYALTNPDAQIDIPDPAKPTGPPKKVKRKDLFNNVMNNLDRKTWNNMQQKQRDILEAAWNNANNNTTNNSNPFNPT